MSRIRVAVVDDHPLFREGVISILGRSPSIEVVAEGASADDAVDIAKSRRPDVMLMDMSMPGGGLEAVRAVAREAPSVRTVMLTVSEANDDVIAAFENGAAGYILKGIVKSDLVSNLEAAYRGETVVSPNLASRLMGKFRKGAPPEPSEDGADKLTPREWDVLDGVSKGLTNKEIAAQLELSDRTVKNYMTSIMTKLRVRNRVEAALTVRNKKAD